MTPQKPLRLWPAVVIAIVQLLVMFGAPVVAPDAGTAHRNARGRRRRVGDLVWWLFFSRAPWSERVGAIVLMIVAVFATRSRRPRVDGGAGQGMMIYILPIPYLAPRSRRVGGGHPSSPGRTRRASMVAADPARVRAFALIRTGGISGGAGSEFHWRWTPTPEQRLLAQGGDEPTPLPPSTAPAPPATPAETPDGDTDGRTPA